MPLSGAVIVGASVLAGKVLCLRCEFQGRLSPTQRARLVSEYRVLSSEYSVPSTQYRVLSTEYSQRSRV
jgi:hypothetical protein